MKMDEVVKGVREQRGEGVVDLCEDMSQIQIGRVNLSIGQTAVILEHNADVFLGRVSDQTLLANLSLPRTEGRELNEEEGSRFAGRSTDSLAACTSAR